MVELNSIPMADEAMFPLSQEDEMRQAFMMAQELANKNSFDTFTSPGGALVGSALNLAGGLLTAIPGVGGVFKDLPGIGDLSKLGTKIFGTRVTSPLGLKAALEVIQLRADRERAKEQFKYDRQIAKDQAKNARQIAEQQAKITLDVEKERQKGDEKIQAMRDRAEESRLKATLIAAGQREQSADVRTLAEMQQRERLAGKQQASEASMAAQGLAAGQKRVETEQAGETDRTKMIVEGRLKEAIVSATSSPGGKDPSELVDDPITGEKKTPAAAKFSEDKLQRRQMAEASARDLQANAGPHIAEAVKTVWGEEAGASAMGDLMKHIQSGKPIDDNILEQVLNSMTGDNPDQYTNDRMDLNMAPGEDSKLSRFKVEVSKALERATTEMTTPGVDDEHMARVRDSKNEIRQKLDEAVQALRNKWAVEAPDRRTQAQWTNKSQEVIAALLSEAGRVNVPAYQKKNLESSLTRIMKTRVDDTADAVNVFKRITDLTRDNDLARTAYSRLSAKAATAQGISHVLQDPTISDAQLQNWMQAAQMHIGDPVMYSSSIHRNGSAVSPIRQTLENYVKRVPESYQAFLQEPIGR